MDPAFEATRSAADGYPGCPYRQILVDWDASADAAAALRAAVGIGGPGDASSPWPRSPRQPA